MFALSVVALAQEPAASHAAPAPDAPTPASVGAPVSAAAPVSAEPVSVASPESPAAPASAAARAPAAAPGAAPVPAATAMPVPEVRAPISEVDHPRYVDAAGQPLRWSEVKELARGSDTLAVVRRRRVGRMLVRVMFTGATAAEAWGTAKLASTDSWTVYALGAQTTLTGLCAVLSFTNEPSAQVEDRALILNEVNRSLGRRP